MLTKTNTATKRMENHKSDGQSLTLTAPSLSTYPEVSDGVEHMISLHPLSLMGWSTASHACDAFDSGNFTNTIMMLTERYVHINGREGSERYD